MTEFNNPNNPGNVTENENAKDAIINTECDDQKNNNEQTDKIKHYPFAEALKADPDTKPVAKLIGENGNIFNLIGICHKVLSEAEMWGAFDEMNARILACGSYDEALCIIMEYVEVE